MHFKKVIRNRSYTFYSRCFSKDVHHQASKQKEILKHLKMKIEATGPISVAEYMKTTLTFPLMGYYMKQDVFGSTGDFITSPEISQIFGELIGIWFCNEWLKAGKPKPLQFVEFGPGRGTLADDIMRVFSNVLPVQKVDLSVHFIEVSPHMRKLQLKSLCPVNKSSDSSPTYEENECDKVFLTKYGYSLKFHKGLESVPDSFSFYLAHEFFDALPIHKFQKTKDGWREILIDCRNEELRFVLSRNATPATKYLIDLNEKRDHLEVCPEAGILVQKICKRMKEEGGITLIVDYGYDGEKTDTFRSFKQHKLHDPLKDPGEADLTSDVDFSYLKKMIKDEGYVVGPVSQAHFLKNMGIDIRLEKLMVNASSEIKSSLKSGYDMLTKADQMGDRFKFFAIYPKVLDIILGRYPPAGF